MRGRFLLLMLISLFAVAPSTAAAQTTAGGMDPSDPPQTRAKSGAGTGAARYGVDPDEVPRYTVPGTRGRRLKNGYAAAPSAAPMRVKKAIWAANEIVGKPYKYGGGHNPSFKDSGYDCSGTVSYALRGGRFVSSPMASGSYMSWAAPGKGRWITTYANSGHMWVEIAGLRLDTSSAGERVSSGEGPRWRKTLRGGAGFVARHPAGF
jgi:hypothetical protein